MRSQWWSPERLRALQRERLRSILQHAGENSPFYRERFAEAGITAADLRSPEVLQAIPPTGREDLQDSGRLISLGYRRDRMRSSRTSGSTGTPTVTWFDPWSWFLGKHLLKLRARMACGLGPLDRVAIFQEEVGPGFRRALAGRRASLSVHSDPSEALALLGSYRPTALYGPPGYLAHLADAGPDLPSVRRIFTSAEMLAPSTRNRLQEAFGAPVLDVYGCTELKEIAWQCEEQGGYHLNCEWIFVEVDPGDAPSGSGEGTILVTSLYNRGMPLIRYRVGDTGRELEGICPCGRGLPLILPGMGRSVDYVHLPDGRAISPYALTLAVEPVNGVRQYQIHQLARDHVRVRFLGEYSPVTGGGEDPVGDAIRSALGPILPGVRVEPERVDRLHREPSGKFRIVRSDVSPHRA